VRVGSLDCRVLFHLVNCKITTGPGFEGAGRLTFMPAIHLWTVEHRLKTEGVSFFKFVVVSQEQRRHQVRFREEWRRPMRLEGGAESGLQEPEESLRKKVGITKFETNKRVSKRDTKIHPARK
jgi:hypothetical protein